MFIFDLRNHVNMRVKFVRILSLRQPDKMFNLEMFD